MRMVFVCLEKSGVGEGGADTDLPLSDIKLRQVIRTYSNRRKQQVAKPEVVESFGLPDTPIFSVETEEQQTATAADSQSVVVDGSQEIVDPRIVRYKNIVSNKDCVEVNSIIGS